MMHCFVHAPNKNGWNGEVLLHLEKANGSFREKEVRNIFESLYPNDDFYSMHYHPDPTVTQVSSYLLRRENGLMQRISVVKSYEDLSFEDWVEGIRKHYPYIAKYAVFVRNYKQVYFDPPTVKIVE